MEIDIEDLRDWLNDLDYRFGQLVGATANESDAVKRGFNALCVIVEDLRRRMHDIEEVLKCRKKTSLN